MRLYYDGQHMYSDFVYGNPMAINKSPLKTRLSNFPQTVITMLLTLCFIHDGFFKCGDYQTFKVGQCQALQLLTSGLCVNRVILSIIIQRSAFWVTI